MIQTWGGLMLAALLDGSPHRTFAELFLKTTDSVGCEAIHTPASQITT